MRIRIRYGVCLFVLLVGNARAVGIDAPIDPVSTASGLFKTPVEKQRDAEYPKASPNLLAEQSIPPAPFAVKPDTKASIDGQARGISADNHVEAESSMLGKERAKLLAEMNKSATVILPPAEFMARPDAGVTRVDNLSLFDAMALSLGYSNEVAASSAHLDTTGYEAASSLGPLLPHVDLRLNGGRESSNPSSLTKLPHYDRLPSDTHNRTDSQFFIRQTLMDLPSYFERQRQNLLLKSAEKSLSDVQERVVYDTLISFLKLIELRLSVVLAENYETELNKLLEYMNARVQAGGGTKADMQRVKGRVLNTASAVIEAKGAYESGLVEFKRLTGVVPYSIAIPVNLLPVLPRDFETAMATAIQNNNQLQAALRDMESVVQERRAMQGKFSPKFDVELSAIRSYNAGGIAGSDPIPNSTLYPVQYDRRAMLVMSWNLADGGADMMQSRALESKRLEYDYHAKEIQRKLEESLRINFNTLRAVNGRVDWVRQEMESNDIVLAAFNEQLFAANRSLLDVLDAYQRQYNSRTELTRLLIDEATAALQMLRNIGKLQEGIVALH